MGIFSGCLLASDIDGTLMSSGYINPKNIEAVKLFLKEGGAFSLSTGRTSPAVSMVLNTLDEISPSVLANGSVIYDFSNKKVLYEKSIPKEDYYIVKKIMELDYDIGVEVHVAGKVLMLKENSEAIDHRVYENFSVEYTSYDEACKYNWNKVLYLLKSPEDLQLIKKVVAGLKIKASDFVETSAVITNRKRDYFEQVPVGISKASALNELCKILGIKKGCLYAIGDYYNDLEMIKKADIGAAPVDSPEDIKESADYITVKCDEGAVADFIEYLYKHRREG